jgi:hypothetical protein
MPTRADVFKTILTEVTGKPKSDISDLLAEFRKTFPGKDKLDDEIPQQEYDRLLTKLRSEKPGILNWLIAGGLHKP